LSSDLSYSLGLLSRFMQDPKDQHLKAVKQVIRYIKRIKEHGIIYKKEGGCKITGYSDSSYGINTDQGKGTTGIVFYFGESPITWCTQKQPTMALSSCESEFMAATGAACQALWLKLLLSELTGWKEERITLKVDNVLAIALVRNPVFHGRSKHIDIRYHFIRECIENGHINVEHVSGELQRADILTKALPRLKTTMMMLSKFAKLKPLLAKDIITATDGTWKGMGEPLQNVDNVIKAADIMIDEQGLHFSPNKVTISTSGLVPQLKRFLHESKCALAISLNATIDEVRNSIMYVLLAGVNDRPSREDDQMAACGQLGNPGWKFLDADLSSGHSSNVFGSKWVISSIAATIF
nr:ribonuclease H-like domain, reverse transcriptase, RNA-dependent DNA polymerase [Tanacetum cinerariifolium]